MIEKNRVVLVAILTALSLLGDSMLYIALPIYWEEWGVESIWMVGLLLSINRLIRIPFNPIVGWLYTKINLRIGLGIALILGSLSTIGYSFADTLSFWIFLRIMWGVAWSLLRIGGLYVVHQNSSLDNSGEMVGTYNGIYRLGSLGGMLIGGCLVAYFGFRETSLLFGFLSLSGIFFLFKLNEKKKREESKVIRDNYMNNNGMALVLVSGFLIAMLYQGLVTSTLSHVIQQYGMEINLFGMVVAASIWAGVIQGIRWVWEPFLAVRVGLWTDGPRGNRLSFYRKTLIFASVSLAVLPVKFSFILFLPIALLCLVGATALTTLTDSVATDEVHRMGGGVSLLSRYTLFQDLGASVGPLVGYLLPKFGLSLTSIYILSAICLVILSKAWKLRQSSLLKSHPKEMATN